MITLRRAKTHLEGLWEFPGGKIEDGESAQQAVIREVAEEVGLSVEPVSTLSPFEHEYEDRVVRIQPIWCQQIGSQAPRTLEVADARWIRPQDLDQYNFPPANAGLIKSLLEGLWP